MRRTDRHPRPGRPVRRVAIQDRDVARVRLRREICQRCHSAEARYDARTQYGDWQKLCPDCFAQVGLALGRGVGQRLCATRKEKARFEQICRAVKGGGHVG